MTELKAVKCDGGCGRTWMPKPGSHISGPTPDGWAIILVNGPTLHACSARCLASIASRIEHNVAPGPKGLNPCPPT